VVSERRVRAAENALVGALGGKNDQLSGSVPGELNG